MTSQAVTAICFTDNERDVVEEAEVQRCKLGIEPYQFEPEYSSDEDPAVDAESQ